MRGRIRAACLAAWAASAVPAPAAAWDFPGHRIVGAIADLVLQQYHPATQQRVSELLQKNDFKVAFLEFDWHLNDLTGGRGE